MKHRYLTLDGEVHGTGLRDQYEGFIELEAVPISSDLRIKIREWANAYHQIVGKRIEQDNSRIGDLDIKGLILMKALSEELGSDYKLRYFSDLKTKELMLGEKGKIIEL